MAHKKAGGSTALGRDSAAQRLGVKIFGDQSAKTGAIIVRQRGTKFHAGKNTKIGGDDTIFATSDGQVKFSRKKESGFTGKLRTKVTVSVEPEKSK